jgi:hypothetical protein
VDFVLKNVMATYPLRIPSVMLVASGVDRNFAMNDGWESEPETALAAKPYMNPPRHAVTTTCLVS